MRAVKSWSVAGLRVELVAERPHVTASKSGAPERSQRVLPPHLCVSTLSAVSIENPEVVLAVVDAFAEAGRALQVELAGFSSGTLDL